MAVLAHVRNIQIRVEHLLVLLFLWHGNRVLDPDLVLRRTVTKLGLALVRTRRQSREEDKPSDRIGFELHSWYFGVSVILPGIGLGQLTANLVLIVFQHQMDEVSHSGNGDGIRRWHYLVNALVQLVCVLLNKVVEQVLECLVPFELVDLSDWKLFDLFHLFAHELNKLFLGEMSDFLFDSEEFPQIFRSFEEFPNWVFKVGVNLFILFHVDFGDIVFLFGVDVNVDVERGLDFLFLVGVLRRKHFVCLRGKNYDILGNVLRDVLLNLLLRLSEGVLNNFAVLGFDFVGFGRGDFVL